MRFYLIRHADPDYANNTITPAGHIEARALARRMQKLAPDRIYTSPLGRARDTARYTTEALNTEASVLEWTQELILPQIGQTLTGQNNIFDVHGHTVHQSGHGFTPENWHLVPPFHHPEYRSAYDKVCTESDAFFASLGYRREGKIYRINEKNRLKIALFCHGGFGLALLAHLLNIPLPLVWVGFCLPTTSVTTILFDERSEDTASARCLGLGDLSHLYAEDLPMQKIGIKTNAE